MKAWAPGKMPDDAAALDELLGPRDARARQHRLEALFLAAHDLDDGVASGDQLRIGGAHLGDQHVDQPVEERLLEAEPAAVAHRPAHDLAQHVAAPFVRRRHAVGDEEGHRPHVVGDHPHRNVGRVHRAAVAALGQPADGLEQRREERRVVVGDGALHHRGDALQPHPGVDRAGRQRGQPAGGVAIELHEDVVPDLDEPLAAGEAMSVMKSPVPGTRRAAIDVDLGAAAARARCRPSPRSCPRRPARRCARPARSRASARRPRRRAARRRRP